MLAVENIFVLRDDDGPHHIGLLPVGRHMGTPVTRPNTAAARSTKTTQRTSARRLRCASRTCSTTLIDGARHEPLEGPSEATSTSHATARAS